MSQAVTGGTAVITWYSFTVSHCAELWRYGTQYGITVVVWVVCWYAVVEDCRRYGRHAAVPSYAETCLQCPQRQVTTFYCSAAELRSTVGDHKPGSGASSGAMIQHTTSSRPRPISHPPATPPTGQRSLEMKTNLREV